MDPEDARQRRIARNCRQISRFLTGPWENKEGKLFCYDFDDHAFAWSTRQALFAGEEPESSEVQRWLAETIEGPLSAIRPRLAGEDPTALDDRKFFKAAVLMLWLQGGWFDFAVAEDVRQDMSKLAALPAGELDDLVASIKDGMALRLVFTTSANNSMAPIFVPSFGIFPFTFPDPCCVSENSIGIGLPLDLHCALALLPSDKGGDADLSPLTPSISNSSIGSAESRRVILPPHLLGAMAESDAAAILEDQREQSESRVADARETRRAILETFARVGVRTQLDRTGRILRAPA